MKPIIKWPGGKRREIKNFSHLLPNNFNVIIEPFFGGGAFSFEYLENVEQIIASDFDEDLILFYNNLGNPHFIRLMNSFANWWDNNGELDADLQAEFANFIENDSHNHPTTKHHFYYFIRHKYNQLKRQNNNGTLRVFCFFVLRELCFSSMFRFNDKGDFNVPFGGHAYIRKQFAGKVDLFNEILTYNIVFSNCDFQQTIEEHANEVNSLIFLDPPYDSPFSTYNNNTFNREDQTRLRDVLLNCATPFILIINDTEFIRELYTNDFFNIESYEKRYAVNFKNRNERSATHLVIRNYGRRLNENN